MFKQGIYVYKEKFGIDGCVIAKWHERKIKVISNNGEYTLFDRDLFNKIFEYKGSLRTEF